MVCDVRHLALYLAAIILVIPQEIHLCILIIFSLSDCELLVQLRASVLLHLAADCCRGTRFR